MQQDYTFHPAVQAWFAKTFTQPTEVQRRAWSAIGQDLYTLLSAPTGSGKTLAAFLSVIDGLVREGLVNGLENTTKVLYISPLKALSNDIQCNLQLPLQGIRAQLELLGLPDLDIRAWVRTGDTPQKERQKAIKQPPHILVSTPESVYILLTSESGRQMLKTVDTVIVDEIHALAGNKRGAHLTLSLERLEALTGKPLQRIGLSATQKPIGTMADFLVGRRVTGATVIDTGNRKERDLELCLTGSPLQAVMSNEAWQEIYDHLEALIREHRSTLVFVNTRRLAERAARFLAERLGEENVMSHHGSMSREKRLAAEQRLKVGSLQCLVATASLELGIDIGDVDLVCQLGSPRSIAAFLQRVGRSGHAVGAVPRGRLFPLTRDELVETSALLAAARNDELDSIRIPCQPLDILAQQIVAEVACREWDKRALFQIFSKAWPYRSLVSEEYSAVVNMLARGFTTRRGRRAAHIHHDTVTDRLRSRQGTRLVALTNGGAIPDQFDYDVILTPEGIRVGTLNEDFAFESLPGDIFQLGNISYRILKTEQGKVFVADARGEPPNIPFWFGEAPGRTDELSQAVSRLREGLDEQLNTGLQQAETWLCQTYGIPLAAAQQLAAYIASAKAALAVVPTQKNIVFERFLDEVGDMHLVIHSPYGSRINRAWGLALRKRFCRKFNFELQAAALEDSIVLSLSATHSFPLPEVATYLHSKTVQNVLTQALLDAPMFATQWRWNATLSLAVRRFSNGRRSPPYFQRADAEDLIAVIFPDQLACLENISGQREIPEHPLVQQTIRDCMNGTMDSQGLNKLLEQIEQHQVVLHFSDLAGPSPLAQEIIAARPYAFLDDAPAEERRTLAVRANNYSSPGDAAELRRLDPAAISRVCAEAWPVARNLDELYDALGLLGFVDAAEVCTAQHHSPLNTSWQKLLPELAETGRATRCQLKAGAVLWVSAERYQEMRQICPDAVFRPDLAVDSSSIPPLTREHALQEIVRSRLECLGPVTDRKLAASLPVSAADLQAALAALEQEGFVIRGQFSDTTDSREQWCERHLLARIHRYTIKQLRSEVEPVSLQDFMRFLFLWQGLTEKSEGEDALLAILGQLEGYSIAAGCWEKEIINARLNRYSSSMLDAVCSSGAMTWLRLSVATGKDKRKQSPLSNTPIALVNRNHLAHWQNLTRPVNVPEINLSAQARKVYDLMGECGALFFADLVQKTGMLKTHLEMALGELVNWGLITSDHFAGLRALSTPQGKRPRMAVRKRGYAHSSRFDRAGRWSRLDQGQRDTVSEADAEFLARIYLKRYGVLCRKLLERETVTCPWRELLRVFWRLEARGEVRGGRFVQGVAGEQFALPESLAMLKSVQREDKNGRMIVLSAADPLNQLGILLPGDKIAALPGNRILYWDGIPIAVMTHQGIRYLVESDASFSGDLLSYFHHQDAQRDKTNHTPGHLMS